jgi:protein-disulfide isomerase
MAFMLARSNPQNPAELATPEQFFPMLSLLLKQQRVWAPDGSNKDVRAMLIQSVKIAGYSEQGFETVRSNQKLGNEILADVERATTDLGVQATPTFFINGKKYSGEMSVESMSAIIDSI